MIDQYCSGIFLSPQTLGFQSLRNYSTENHLTHVSSDGKAKMVDVGGKNVTDRMAVAKARIFVGDRIFQLIKKNEIAKGDVLSIAKISGIINAKRTSEMIPLCHNLMLNAVNIETEMLEASKEIEITGTVKCCGKTGVEIEALVSVSTAALTIYDMCKAISHDMVIRDIYLVKKSGGKSDFHTTHTL